MAIPHNTTRSDTRHPIPIYPRTFHVVDSRSWAIMQYQATPYPDFLILMERALEWGIEGEDLVELCGVAAEVEDWLKEKGEGEIND